MIYPASQPPAKPWKAGPASCIHCQFTCYYVRPAEDEPAFICPRCGYPTSEALLP